MFFQFSALPNAMGGYRYYRATQEAFYQPDDFLHRGKNVRIEAGVSITAPERLYLGIM